MMVSQPLRPEQTASVRYRQHVGSLSWKGLPRGWLKAEWVEQFSKGTNGEYNKSVIDSREYFDWLRDNWYPAVTPGQYRTAIRRLAYSTIAQKKQANSSTSTISMTLAKLLLSEIELLGKRKWGFQEQLETMDDYVPPSMGSRHSSVNDGKRKSYLNPISKLGQTQYSQEANLQSPAADLRFSSEDEVDLATVSPRSSQSLDSYDAGSTGSCTSQENSSVYMPEYASVVRKTETQAKLPSHTPQRAQHNDFISAEQQHVSELASKHLQKHSRGVRTCDEALLHSLITPQRPHKRMKLNDSGVVNLHPMQLGARAKPSRAPWEPRLQTYATTPGQVYPMPNFINPAAPSANLLQWAPKHLAILESPKVPENHMAYYLAREKVLCDAFRREKNLSNNEPVAFYVVELPRFRPMLYTNDECRKILEADATKHYWNVCNLTEPENYFWSKMHPDLEAYLRKVIANMQIGKYSIMDEVSVVPMKGPVVFVDKLVERAPFGPCTLMVAFRPCEKLSLQLQDRPGWKDLMNY